MRHTKKNLFRKIRIDGLLTQEIPNRRSSSRPAPPVLATSSDAFSTLVSWVKWHPRLVAHTRTHIFNFRFLSDFRFRFFSPSSRHLPHPTSLRDTEWGLTRDASRFSDVTSWMVEASSVVGRRLNTILHPHQQLGGLEAATNGRGGAEMYYEADTYYHIGLAYCN